jgi:membrane protease YdiL (CAAX protease family)
MTRAGHVLALYGGMGLIALVISGGGGDPDIYRLEAVSTTGRLLLSPLLGLAIGVAFVALSRLAVRRWEWARRLHTDFRHLLGPLSQREIVVLALASAVGEELMFRGALQPLLASWGGGAFTGVVGQAIVFALLHVGPGVRFLPWTASSLAIALVFGALYQLTGDLGGPIVAHFAINYLNLGYIARVEHPGAAADPA